MRCYQNCVPACGSLWKREREQSMRCLDSSGLGMLLCSRKVCVLWSGEVVALLRSVLWAGYLLIGLLSVKMYQKSWRACRIYRCYFLHGSSSLELLILMRANLVVLMFELPLFSKSPYAANKGIQTTGFSGTKIFNSTTKRKTKITFLCHSGSCFEMLISLH